MSFEPAYLSLQRSGELDERVRRAYERLHECDICPRKCGGNRRSSAKGAVCRTGERARVASYFPHRGEEAALVGSHGSGTIFFSRCNLFCQYCQNSELSQLGEGTDMEPEAISRIMLWLQRERCHNINLVSPTHVVPQILAALSIAAREGLCLPLVYNSGGYDSLDTLALLDGIVDIYMPDCKYANAQVGWRLSGVPDYPEVNQAAVLEMHRQVGDLVVDENGVAQKGLLVRHLVLPGDLAGTAQVARFLAEEVSTNTYLNAMGQYRPCFKAGELPPLDRRITDAEYRHALRLAGEAGLWRLAD